MLTATDVHYLVGFLTLMSSPESVEIVLGDLVYDKAVGARRDVDVTVKYGDTKATTSVFKGIEVKKFGRRMDTPQVEQLVGKFGDMPTVSQKAIVSASGFTKGAIRKASSHNVDLFTFSDWSNPMSGFNHVKFAPWMISQQLTYTFASEPVVLFNSEEFPLNESDVISNADGNQVPGCATTQELTDYLQRIALGRDDVHSFLQGLASHEQRLIRVTVSIPCEIYSMIAGKRRRLTQAILMGLAMRADLPLEVDFKILTKLGEQVPMAGCAITELSNKTLIAIALGQANRSVQSFAVPLSTRNQEKIRLLKLR